MTDSLLHLSTAAMTAMARHALTWYPDECCGLIFRDATTGTDACQPMDNLQDRYHQRLPEDFPRTARDAFKMDERQVARLRDAAATEGRSLIGIFHSHIDCSAYFSREDIAMAAPFGTPNEPDLWHVVLDCHADGVRGAAAFRWDGASFARFELDFPPLATDSARS